MKLCLLALAGMARTEVTTKWYAIKEFDVGNTPRNWLGAKKFCEDQGAQMCTKGQICESQDEAGRDAAIAHAMSFPKMREWFESSKFKHVSWWGYKYNTRNVFFGDEYMGALTLDARGRHAAETHCTPYYTEYRDYGSAYGGYEKLAGDANSAAQEHGWQLGLFGQCCAFNAPPNQVVTFDYDGPEVNGDQVTWEGTTVGTYYKYLVAENDRAYTQWKFSVSGTPIRIGFASSLNLRSGIIEIGLGEWDSAKSLYFNTVRFGPGDNKYFYGLDNVRKSYNKTYFEEKVQPLIQNELRITLTLADRRDTRLHVRIGNNDEFTFSCQLYQELYKKSNKKDLGEYFGDYFYGFYNTVLLIIISS